VQSKDNKGNTLLHEALPRAFDDGHVKIVELCLAKGLDVNALNNDNSTPLHAAAWRGDGEFAELLLSKGADLNAKNKQGATPLAYAVQDTARNVVRANRTRTALLLINAGADLDVGLRVKDGKTLLHWAAGKGFTEVIEALVAKGADVNARTESLSRTDQRKTPLHVAAYEGHAESVKVLVANGADVHAVDKGKNTPLLSATGNHREKPGKFEIVKLLVEKGANVNAVENCDRSALYHAASHNELEILEYLISKGADVNVRNRCSSGETPLHAAAKDGDMDVAKLLIASGVDVNAITENRTKRRDKKSPLHFASEKGHGDLAELLIKNGANVKMQDGNGDTVLHLAAVNGDKALIRLFLDNGADVNAKNAEGMTPLHKAGRGGVRNTMEAGGILLQGGANINEVVQSGKYEGRTILDFVEKMNTSSREDYRKSVVRYF
jgi:cytohesin